MLSLKVAICWLHWTMRLHFGMRWGPVIADVLAGKIHPKVAAVLPPLLTLQLNAIRIADVAQQLAAFERQSKLDQQSKLGDGTSDDPAPACDQNSGSGATNDQTGERWQGTKPNGFTHGSNMNKQ